MYYTYIHRTVDTGRVFYVGKGIRDRYKVATGRSERWSRTVAKHGFVPEIAAKWKNEEEAFAHERFLILCFKDLGFDLANLTDGGEGASGNVQSEETKEKRNAQLRGRPKSAETIARMKAAHAGKVIRPETRRKLSDWMRGRWVGADNPTSRACVCIETGSRFNSFTEAGDWLKSIGHSKASFKSISAAISGVRKTAYGYRWALSEAA